MAAAIPSANGALPADARGAALYYLRHGWAPVPVRPRSKRPTLEKWEELRLTEETVADFFPIGAALNNGIILGKPSGGLVDVDLDQLEAVRAAPFFLPQTPMVHGRPGKPRSHFWYVLDRPPAKASCKFKDVDGKTLLELRSTGGQTVVPPSVHETGERIVWHSFGTPPTITVDKLRPAVCNVAAAALIARHWPAKGSRHDLALALAGGLLRGGLTVEQAERFLRAVCVAAQTADVETKVRTVQDTRAKLDAGENVVGWPNVAAIVGEPVVARVRQWLKIDKTVRNTSAAPQPRVRVREVQPYRPFPVEALRPPAVGVHTFSRWADHGPGAAKVEQPQVPGRRSGACGVGGIAASRARAMVAIGSRAQGRTARRFVRVEPLSDTRHYRHYPRRRRRR
jgi:hypothetical protein